MRTSGAASASTRLPPLRAARHDRPSLDAPRCHRLGTQLAAILVASGIAQPQLSMHMPSDTDLMASPLHDSQRPTPPGTPPE